MAEKLVTRKVIKDKKYLVCTLNNGILVPRQTLVTKGKVSCKELAKGLNVDQVVLQEKEVTYATYAMTVEDFMKHATLIKEENIVK